MLLFILYNFGWYVYHYTFPEQALGRVIQDEVDGQLKPHGI